VKITQQTNFLKVYKTKMEESLAGPSNNCKKIKRSRKEPKFAVKMEVEENIDYDYEVVKSDKSEFLFKPEVIKMELDLDEIEAKNAESTLKNTKNVIKLIQRLDPLIDWNELAPIFGKHLNLQEFLMIKARYNGT
jgi:hypothetical protein